MTRSAEVQQLQQEFFYRGARRLIDYALDLAADREGFDEIDRRRTVRKGKELMRILSAVDNQRNNWTDTEMARYIEFYLNYFDLRAYPLSAVPAIRLYIRLLKGEGFGSGFGEAVRLNDNGNLLYFYNGIWKFTHLGRDKTIAALDDLFTTTVRSDATYTSELIEQKLLQLKNEIGENTGGLTDEERQALEELIAFKESFDGIDPSGFERKENKNKAGGYAGIDSFTGKIPPELLPYVETLRYRGPWQADINNPNLQQDNNGEDVYADFYIVQTPGETVLSGIAGWQVGDWLVWNPRNMRWDRYPFSDYYGNGLGGVVSDCDCIVIEPVSYEQAGTDTCDCIAIEPISYS